MLVIAGYTEVVKASVIVETDVRSPRATDQSDDWRELVVKYVEHFRVTL